MNKKCVFCGKQPDINTSEHVLPLWLIKYTGDPNRTAIFGYKHLKNGNIVNRRFSFKSFKFPACNSCNKYYSEMENNTQAIIKKMIAEESVSELELSNLLDWFDKVRIGLWLGYRYLDKDKLGVTPHYHIEQRIAKHDRMLLILKASDNMKGLTFIGCDTPAFGFTPSCFSLRINNYCFFNMSYPNMISRRIGFPSASESFMMEDDRIYSTFVRGHERIMKPY